MTARPTTSGFIARCSPKCPSSPSRPVHDALSTRRLLTMGWLAGRRLTELRATPSNGMSSPAPCSRPGGSRSAAMPLIHGDPHLGNYTARLDASGRPGGLNLLDFGCIRIFPACFVGGVVELYRGLLDGDRDRVVGA